jgi:hypothetical protein
VWRRVAGWGVVAVVVSLGLWLFADTLGSRPGQHPQYLGLILIVIGRNVQGPTLRMLAMAPVLVVIVRLARREDEELGAIFGQAFPDYAAPTPAFVPLGPGLNLSPLGCRTRSDRDIGGRAGPVAR